jgi:hypothetical protein
LTPPPPPPPPQHSTLTLVTPKGAVQLVEPAGRFSVIVNAHAAGARASRHKHGASARGRLLWRAMSVFFIGGISYWFTVFYELKLNGSQLAENNQ